MRTQNLLAIILLTTTFPACLHNKSKLTILFDRVDGLEVGAKFYQKGIPVGEVTGLDLFDRGVIADINLKDKTQIPIDSKFIVNTSVLGTTSITVEPSDKKLYMTSKDTIVGHYNDKKLLDEVISDSSKRQTIQKSLDKIGEGVKEILETTKDTTHKN